MPTATDGCPSPFRLGGASEFEQLGRRRVLVPSTPEQASLADDVATVREPLDRGVLKRTAMASLVFCLGLAGRQPAAA